MLEVIYRIQKRKAKNLKTLGLKNVYFYSFITLFDINIHNIVQAYLF